MSAPTLTTDTPVRLTPLDLLRTAQAFAVDRDLSAALDLSADERGWLLLAARPHLQIWLLSWPPGASTGWHDHGRANGAFVGVRGTLTEQTFAHGITEREVGSGGRAFGSRHIHNVINSGQDTALSVHAYSPALTEMTRYDLVDGALEITGVERAGVDW